MSDEKLQFIALMQEKQRRLDRNKLATYSPYPKQREFHAAGLQHRERLFMAGNQLGKTMAGGAETAMHLTGRYPDWWDGWRSNKPIVAWAAGVSNEGVRDGCQRILMGRLAELGTGWLPHNAILDVAKKRGVDEAIDNVVIKHISGGISYLHFKSYDQGREKFQAETLHWFWCDEEPPEDIYLEGITRTNATQGPVIVTFTPLQGLSRVVKRFINESSPDRHITRMTIDDAAHYTPEQREKIKASYPDHERDARTNGIPILGSGMVFPVAESQFIIQPIQIPDHWVHLGGMDFGYDHPFAAVEVAWDRDQDCIYVIREYATRQTTPSVHCMALRSWGSGLPWAWPHDGLQHSKDSGVQLKQQYAKAGLHMLPFRATYPDGTSGVEAGVLDMLDRLQTGRLKIFTTCQGLLDEMRIYHRDEGKLVKVDDDRISALRYAVMMMRHARIVETLWGRKKKQPKFADNDYAII